jgi:hypothetical protein
LADLAVFAEEEDLQDFKYPLNVARYPGTWQPTSTVDVQRL